MSINFFDDVFNVSDDDNLSIVREAPEDEQQPAEQQSQDQSQEEAPQEEEPRQDGDQQQDNQENQEEQPEENNQDDNFDIDSDGNDDEGDQGNEDDRPDGEQDTGEDQQNADDQQSEESMNQKELYDQLYKNLTPEEKAYRDMCLMNEYKELHTLCGNIIYQTSYFPNTDQSQELMKRIITSLHNLRKYISFYIINIYRTKSFYENKFQYEIYLQIFNSIKSIFKDIETMMAHTQDNSENNN